MAIDQKNKKAEARTWRTSEAKQSEEIKIDSLKYKSDLKKESKYVKVYFDYLDVILNSKNLFNIALTGNRGFGKSSIIHSYDNMRNNGQERFLYISLAEFEHYVGEDEEEHSDKTKGKKKSKKQKEKTTGNDAIQYITVETKRKTVKKQDREAIQKKLEYSMLSQILARCTEKELRNSSLQPIPEISGIRRGGWFKYLFAFMTGLLVWGLIYEDHFGLALKLLWNWSDLERVRHHAIGYLATFVLLFIGGACLIRKKTGILRFGKLAFKTPLVDAEISPSERIFCLDHYRFELIHILNQIAPKINYTVVIEDLDLVDEYCAEAVMSKLRELNLIINTHRKAQCEKILNNNGGKLDSEQNTKVTQKRLRKKSVNCKNPVRFIYAISDEVLDEMERTKFFDTILPVNPIMNHTNAYDFIYTEFAGETDKCMNDDDKIKGGQQPEPQQPADEIQNNEEEQKSVEEEQKAVEKEVQDWIEAAKKAITDQRLLNDITTEYHFLKKWYEANNQEKRRQYAVNNSGEAGEKKDFEVARELIAIAAYKALLPYEYHYAFTRQGGGELLNPRYRRIKGRKYDDKVVIFVDFLFRYSYLHEESLRLVGFSKEEIFRRWDDVMIFGTNADCLAILRRIDPTRSEDPNAWYLDYDLPKDDELQKKSVDVILEIAKLRFGGDAEEAVRAYYSNLTDNKLRAEGLLNMLCWLSRYEDEELKAALENVNKTKDPAIGEKIKKEFRLELKLRLQTFKKEYDTRESLKLKYERVAHVIDILLGKSEDEVK